MKKIKMKENNIREKTRDKINSMGYKILKEYKNDNSESWRIFVKDNLGYKYDSYLKNFLRNRHFHIVGKDNLFSLYNISLWLKLNNKDFKLCKDNIYKNSHDKLKFYHSKCRDYFYTTWSHIYKNTGCSICSGRQVGKYNNLEYLLPKLVKEWHPENKLKPNEVTLKSSKNVMWICSICGYGENGEWKTPISSRTSGSGCPSCAGNIVSDKNRLSILCPNISKRWHPSKNGNLTPSNVSYGSIKKVWWLCENGHSVFLSPNIVTNKNRYQYICSVCSIESGESLIATELKKYYKEKYFAETEKSKGCKNPETGRPLFFDIYIPNKNIFIEVNGEQHYKIGNWHERTSKIRGTTPKEEFEHDRKLDNIKRKFARKNGTYIEIDLRKIKTTEDAIKYIEKFL